jgi:beta-N-acetylhexosaminidase
MMSWVRRHTMPVLAAVAAAVLLAAVWAVSRDAPRAAPAVPRALSASGNPLTGSSTTPAPGRTVPASARPGTAPGANACVTATLGRLSAAERVGQLLMIGTPVNGPRTLAGTVTRYHLGGVFLAGRSRRSAAALRADVHALQKAARVPLLVALDQEGGSVQTLRGADFPDIPSATRLGRGSQSALRDEVRGAARRLAGIGVTVNLAPVADTVPAALGTGNPPIGAFHRQYGSDPRKVAADIRTVVTASQGVGVLTTLKHFPGLGRVRANTDTSTHAVDAVTSPSDPYLGPFRAGVRQGSAAVMVSSASYPRLDRAAIAAFSAPIITGLLRRDLRFTGLVMSDDLGAAVAVAGVPTGQRAVRFVRAGGDLVLTVRPQDAAPMASALRAAARSSPAFAARVTDAARHVLQAKYRAGLLRC